MLDNEVTSTLASPATIPWRRHRRHLIGPAAGSEPTAETPGATHKQVALNMSGAIWCPGGRPEGAVIGSRTRSCHASQGSALQRLTLCREKVQPSQPIRCFSGGGSRQEPHCGKARRTVVIRSL